MGNLTHTVSGGIASFRSAARVPIESLKCHFLPVQEGSGDPSPENVRPITGWNGCTIYKAGKNLFNFDINNVEYDVLNDKGELRSIYHTGIISDGRKISASAALIDAELTGNTTINLGYLQNGTLYQITALMNWETGAGYSKTVSIPIGQELLLVNAANSAWGWTRNIPRYNIQIEINDINTTFEPYYNEIIPITFPNINKNKFEVTPLSYDDWTGEGYINYYLDNMNPIIDTTNKTISITCRGSGDSILYKKTHYAPGTYTLSYDMTYSGNINTVYKRMVVMCFKKDGTIMTEEDISIPGLTWNKYYKGFFAIAGTFTVPETVDYFTICFGISRDTKGETATFSNIQLEVGSVATAYEPYNYNNSLCGGYIDVATGEIYQTWQYFDLYYYRNYFEWVQEWGVFWIDPNLRTGKPKKMFSSLSNVYPYGGQYNRMPDKTTGYIYYYDIAIRDDSFNGDLASFKASIQEGQYVVYELDTPIFVAKLSSLELQTFIDYNNIQSNTNDITEVVYQIHDSNMIKERKLALISNNNQYYKKVIWNQIMPVLNENNYVPYSTNRSSVTFNNGIATHTYTVDQIGSYSVSIRSKVYPQVIEGHTYYASYMVCPDYFSSFGLEFANNHQFSGQYPVYPNAWRRCSFECQCTKSGGGTMYIPFPYGLDIYEGQTDQIKAPIYIDLTQMFGEGNEPPLREFEALCKFNHVNLEEYHEQNTTGIPQVWIIPKRKKVIWNQIAPYPSLTNYQPYDNQNTLTEENGILTITYGVKSRDYHNSIMDKKTIKYYQNHKYYVKQDFCPSWNSTGIGVSICNYGGLYYPQATANQYTTSSYILEKLTVDGYHNILLAYPYNENNLSIGDTCKVRNIILVDLTLMFGEGHEPTTAEEFEALCEKNYINLDFYQAKDAGTEQLWII